MYHLIPPDITTGIARESLGIEVTTRCNASCTYCFVRAGAPLPSDLDFECVQGIMAEGYRLGYRNLHISGGEPFLWDGLLTAVEYATACGYQTIFINTNGILLTPEVSRRLAAHGTVWVSVSLQGPENFHDRVRDKVRYPLVRNHIAAALQTGLKISLFTTVFKSLLPSLPEFTRDMFAVYPGLRCLAFIQLIRVPGDVFDLSNELIDPDDFLILVQMVSLLRLYGLRIDVLNNPLAGATAKALGLPWEAWSHPLTSPGRLMIRANGDITASHSGRRCFGQYQPGELPNILSSPQYAAAVGADCVTCPSCRFLNHCRGSDMVRPSEPFRDHNGTRPFCQRVLAKACRDTETVVAPERASQLLTRNHR